MLIFFFNFCVKNKNINKYTNYTLDKFGWTFFQRKPFRNKRTMGGRRLGCTAPFFPDCNIINIDNII